MGWWSQRALYLIVLMAGMAMSVVAYDVSRISGRMHKARIAYSGT